MTTSFFTKCGPKGSQRASQINQKSLKMVLKISFVLDGRQNLILETFWLKIMPKIHENLQGNAETHFQDNDPNEKLDTSKTL